jgi:adenine-specific DNA-methyltransferase
MQANLIARLGSHALFADATIDASIYIGRKREQNTHDFSAISFWADHRLKSNSAALRALRRSRYYDYSNVFPIEEDGYSIYLNPELGSKNMNWAPRPYSAWNLLKQLELLPRVNDLFSVKQGVRTGDNDTFILEKFQLLALPIGERAYFRPAIVNRSINFNQLNDDHYIFYPYGNLAIQTEDELQRSVPEYYRKYLSPREDRLKKRAKINVDQWWLLTWHRAWQVVSQPKLTSKYFGYSGAFAWDGDGKYVVVQGYGWVPKGVNRQSLLTPELGLAYAAVLNSSLFFDLVSAVSNHVGGGQWNLSTKFVNRLPLPDLFSESISPKLVEQLSLYGRIMSEGHTVESKAINEAMREAYGLI